MSVSLSNPHIFDRLHVRKQIRERVNEHWQSAIKTTILHEAPSFNLRILQARVITAARTLRTAIEHEIPEIENECGLLGERLDEAQFIELANQSIRERVVPACEALNHPKSSFPSPSADPNFRMRQVVLDSWRSHFFEPQRQNIGRVIGGLLMATVRSAESQRAQELVERFQTSVLVPDYLAVRDLIDTATNFLQVTRLDPPPPERASWLHGKLRALTGYEATAFSRKVKDLGIATPSRGKSNHSYSPEEAFKILTYIQVTAKEEHVRRKCTAALNEHFKSTLNHS